MVSWLAHLSLNQAVRVQALAGDINVVFLGKAFNPHSASLSTQECNWVQVNCRGSLTNRAEVTCNGLASHLGGAEIFLAASSCYGNQGKLWQLPV